MADEDTDEEEPGAQEEEEEGRHITYTVWCTTASGKVNNLYKVNMQVHVKQSVEVTEVYDVLAASKQYLAKAVI